MKRKYLLGLILIVGMVVGLRPSQANYAQDITATGFIIGIDVYHEGYHANADDLAPLIGNLTAAGNTVVLINETWQLWDNMSALILTQPDLNFTASEKQDVVDWLSMGYKLLVAGGDSDFGGYYDDYPLNSLLAEIGTIARFAAISVEDPVYNDGSAYRTAPWVIGTPDRPGVGDVIANATIGMDGTNQSGIILHGPGAVMAYDGTYYKDLRAGASSFPQQIEIILQYSPNATALDSDVSNSSYDLYAYDSTIGDYPAVVYENLKHTVGNESHMILAGECFWTYYKYMYNSYSENGAYNDDGRHYGYTLFNNILNYLLEMPPVEPEPTNFGFALIPVAIIASMWMIVRRRK